MVTQLRRRTMSMDGNSTGVRTIKASEFKAKCLKLMDEVAETGQEIVITKNGKPVSRLAPYRAKQEPQVRHLTAGRNRDSHPGRHRISYARRVVRRPRQLRRGPVLILLDTHVLIWFRSGRPPRLGPQRSLRRVRALRSRMRQRRGFCYIHSGKSVCES